MNYPFAIVPLVIMLLVSLFEVAQRLNKKPLAMFTAIFVASLISLWAGIEAGIFFPYHAIVGSILVIAFPFGLLGIITRILLLRLRINNPHHKLLMLVKPLGFIAAIGLFVGLIILMLATGYVNLD